MTPQPVLAWHEVVGVLLLRRGPSPDHANRAVCGRLTRHRTYHRRCPGRQRDGGLSDVQSTRRAPGSRDFRHDWLMGMAARPIVPAADRRAMPSLEPLTVGAAGYARAADWRVLQGAVNTDRPHPHELFSHAAVGWSQRVAQTTSRPGRAVGEGPGNAVQHRARRRRTLRTALPYILDSTTCTACSRCASIGGVLRDSRRSGPNRRRHYDVEFGRRTLGRASLFADLTWTVQASHGFFNAVTSEPETAAANHVSVLLKRRCSGFTR